MECSGLLLEGNYILIASFAVENVKNRIQSPISINLQTNYLNGNVSKLFPIKTESGLESLS